MILFFLFLKHLIVDFFLQTPYQYKNKGTYGHLGGLLHAALHGLSTGLIVVLFGNHSSVGYLFAIVEGVIHYHIDWLKVNLTKNKWSHMESDGLKITSDHFFDALGIDQFLHNITYVAIYLLLK